MLNYFFRVECNQTEFTRFSHNDLMVALVALPSWHLHQVTKNENRPDLLFVADCTKNSEQIDLQRPDFLKVFIGK